MSDSSLLRIVQNRYGDRWSIRRTSSLWLAIAYDPDIAHVVHEDLDLFLSELEHPSPRTDVRSLLSVRYFSHRAEPHGDGTYRFEDST